MWRHDGERLTGHLDQLVDLSIMVWVKQWNYRREPMVVEQLNLAGLLCMLKACQQTNRFMYSSSYAANNEYVHTSSTSHAYYNMRVVECGCELTKHE